MKIAQLIRFLSLVALLFTGCKARDLVAPETFKNKTTVFIEAEKPFVFRNNGEPIKVAANQVIAFQLSLGQKSDFFGLSNHSYLFYESEDKQIFGGLEWTNLQPSLEKGKFTIDGDSLGQAFTIVIQKITEETKTEKKAVTKYLGQVSVGKGPYQCINYNCRQEDCDTPTGCREVCEKDCFFNELTESQYDTAQHTVRTKSVTTLADLVSKSNGKVMSKVKITFIKEQVLLD